MQMMPATRPCTPASLGSLLCITGPSVASLLHPRPQPWTRARLQTARLAQVQAAAAPARAPASRPRAQPQPGADSRAEKSAGRGSGSASQRPKDSTRLNKALAAAGVCSRRGADDLVFAGKVSVNGKVVSQPGMQVMLGRDRLAVDGRPISTAAATNKYYFALNKPKGYVCSSARDGSGGSGDRLITDLLSNWLHGWKLRHPGSGPAPRLFTVGRLDVQSIGLVLITNDGDWAQQVQHPSSGLTKEYSVTLDRRPGRSEMDALAAGCDVDGVRVVPVAVSLDDSDRSKPNRVRVVLAEGRNREVRRLVEAAGMEVKVLRRVRVGGYRLPRGLGFGQFVELRPHEVRRVLNIGADRTV